MGVKAMAAKKANNTVPPYISGREFNYFVTKLGEEIPNCIDEAWLISIDVTAGNTAPLLSALRWLRLIDTWGTPSPDKSSLKRLANPSQRPDAFKQLLETIYPYNEIVKLSNLHRLTLQQAVNKFRKDYNVVPGTDMKCARFFFYMAGEAGIKLGETIELPPDRRLLSPRANNPKLNGQHQLSFAENSNEDEADEGGIDYVGHIESIAKFIKEYPDKLTALLLRRVRGWLEAQITDQNELQQANEATRKLVTNASEISLSNPQLATDVELLDELTALHDLVFGIRAH